MRNELATLLIAYIALDVVRRKAMTTRGTSVSGQVTSLHPCMGTTTEPQIWQRYFGLLATRTRMELGIYCDTNNQRRVFKLVLANASRHVLLRSKVLEELVRFV